MSQWPAADVAKYVNAYKGEPAYLLHDTQPFVSTFEGWENANDWHFIKSDTHCFFMPDWSSRGAQVAMTLEGGIADGLFSKSTDHNPPSQLSLRNLNGWLHTSKLPQCSSIVTDECIGWAA